MLFKIKSNPMYPVGCALPLPYVPARVTRGALIAHRHSFASTRCRFCVRASQNLCAPLGVSLERS